MAQRQESDEVGLREAVFDERFAYFFGPSSDPSVSELGIARLPLSAEGAATERVALTSSVASLAIHGDYLYWLGSDPDNGGLTRNLGFVERAKKDGSTAPERLVSHLELATRTGAQGSPHLELAVDDHYFYWSRSALLGSISRCLVTGCTGTPETVTSPVRFPLGLLPDGPNLYWAYRSDAFSYSIAGCTSATCQPTLAMIPDATAANALTADEHYLYTATTETPFYNDDQWTSFTSTIRRFPK